METASEDVMNEIVRLRAALRDALEGLEEMLPYVPDFFVQKWALDGYVGRARDAVRASQ